MENKLTYEYHHCEANNKVRDIMNKQKKSPKTLRLIERRQEITNLGDLRFEFGSTLPKKSGSQTDGEKRKKRVGSNRHRTTG